MRRKHLPPARVCAEQIQQCADNRLAWLAGRNNRIDPREPPMRRCLVAAMPRKAMPGDRRERALMRRYRGRPLFRQHNAAVGGSLALHRISTLLCVLRADSRAGQVFRIFRHQAGGPAPIENFPQQLRRRCGGAAGKHRKCRHSRRRNAMLSHLDSAAGCFPRDSKC